MTRRQHARQERTIEDRDEDRPTRRRGSYRHWNDTQEILPQQYHRNSYQRSKYSQPEAKKHAPLEIV